MKKQVLILCVALAGCFFANAQTSVSVADIQFVSATDLANCEDLSSYDGQLIKTVGVVMHDGNLTELASGSVNGGYRPGVHILDTAANGAMGGFAGVQIHGVYTDGGSNSQPVSFLDNLVAGMVIEVIGTVSNYQGETQVFPSDNSSVSVISTISAPTPEVIDLALLNDDSRSNIYTTGEEYEGSLVTLENVTVVGVSIFSGNRVSFDVSDANGNLINVSDRFLVQKMSSRDLVNPSSPQSDGEFVAPVVGTLYESLTGIVMHSENGCSGGSGRGYELNPFDTSHYKVGDTPPNISEVSRDPVVPTSSAGVTISANITDFNGTVDDQKIYYTDDMSHTVGQFTEATMTLVSGTTDEFEYTLPAFADGTIIRYYITATDNDGNKSYSPFAAGSANPSFNFFTVRDNGLSIVDLQKVLDVNQDASPYLGQTVTVKGYVVASAKSYDIEDVYLQDKDATEWGGIRVSGNAGLLDLWRTEEVEVTGEVQESFGFTQLNVTSVSKTGKTFDVQPIELNVSDSAFYEDDEAEKYESMLVKMVNTSGKVYISNPRLNPFGEWTISDNEDASFANSTKVQTGVKNGTNNSSLWVSVVSNDTLANDGGIMEVDAIETEKGMEMDALIGIMYYGFSQYSVKPRNNDDLVNFSVALDSTNYADTVAGSVLNLSQLGIKFYPNPANDVLTISAQNNLNATVIVRGLDGRKLSETTVENQLHTLQVGELTSGVYIIEVITKNNQRAASRFIKL